MVASGHAALAWAVSLKIMTGTGATSPDSWFPMTYNVFFVINNNLTEPVFVSNNNFLPVLAHYRTYGGAGLYGAASGWWW